MSQLVANCPRCGAQKMAFEVLGTAHVGNSHDWQMAWEVFGLCGHCNRTATFLVLQDKHDMPHMHKTRGALVAYQGTINDLVRIIKHISVSDADAMEAPEFLPEDVNAAFTEGAKCMTIGCYNAAGTMFRLCVDHTSRSKLPAVDGNGLNQKVRRDLGLRLPWLFDNGLLAQDLRELSACIREDGNDGAHRGTLTKEDALDLLDFTVELVTRVYTEPERLRIAKERRDARRIPATP